MVAMVEITDHVARAQALVPSCIAGPQMLALIGAFVGELQKVEVLVFDLLDQQQLANAVGVHLDSLGAEAGLSRTSTSDARYRLTVQAKRIVNAGSGTVDALLDAATLILSNMPLDAQLTELVPGSIALYSADVPVVTILWRSNNDAALAEETENALEQVLFPAATAAGVAFRIVRLTPTKDTSLWDTPGRGWGSQWGVRGR